jgi:hypothetical protein
MRLVVSVRPPAARIRVVLVVAVALLAAGCGSTLSVQTQRDASIPIPAGATWGWNPTPPAERLPGELDPRADNPTIHGRVERAIEATLASKGFRQVEPVTAEFLVNYRVGVREVQQLQQIRAGGVGTTHMTVLPAEFTQGGLLIDLLERSTGKLAFRSWAVEDVEKGAGSEKAIQDIVTRLLKELP